MARKLTATPRKTTRRARVSAPPKPQPNPGKWGSRILGFILSAALTTCFLTVVVVGAILISRVMNVNINDGYEVSGPEVQSMEAYRGDTNTFAYTVLNTSSDNFTFTPIITGVPPDITCTVAPTSQELEPGQQIDFVFTLVCPPESLSTSASINIGFDRVRS